MIGRLAGLRGRLSSQWLASTFAIAYLLLSITLGVALLSTPTAPRGEASPSVRNPTHVYEQNPAKVPLPVPDSPDDSGTFNGSTGSLTVTATPRSTSPPPPGPAAPAGFQRVSGPAGLRTVIPAGWPSTRTTGPGAMQATDPADAGRYVKYGGSPAPMLAIETSHIHYENGFAARAIDYRRIILRSADYAGHNAVEWEFEHRDGPNLSHVRSLYWRAEGKEYFVLAAAPATHWAQMQPIYDAMVANATP